MSHLLLAATLTAVPITAPAVAVADAPATKPSAASFGFEERFTTLEPGAGQQWGWQTSAYSGCTDNPEGGKLDHLTPSALSTRQGYLTITATARPDGRWDTGLLTTGDSCGTGGDGTQVRTGDLLMAHIRLPAKDSGAWPGLWTWQNGGNELDVFEWHGDHPDTLEFVNHVHEAWTSYSNPGIGPGRWLYVGVRFGADNTTWYEGPRLDQLTAAYSDHTGVGPDFAAYPILNLSIDDGKFHHPPTTTDPVTLAVDYLALVRPAPDSLPQP